MTHTPEAERERLARFLWEHECWSDGVTSIWDDADDAWRERCRKVADEILAMLCERQQEGWKPISELPDMGREMFVVRAFNVSNGFTGGRPYTSDAWAVWRDGDGFARWPHNFPPTHFHLLPPFSTPASEGESQ